MMMWKGLAGEECTSVPGVMEKGVKQLPETPLGE